MTVPPYDRAFTIATLLVLATAILVGAPALAGGQEVTASPRAASVLRVQVADSAGRPVGGVEVSVLVGLRAVAARRITDDGGRATLVVDAEPGGSGDYQVAARRVGLAPASRFVRVRAGDTVSVALMLAPLPAQLGEVRVTAKEDLRRRNYYLDADMIAGSTALMRDALEAIAALRPNMFTSIGGPRVCPPMHDVWINGVRVPLNFAPDPLVADRMLPGVTWRGPVSGVVKTILSRIRPEHIAEITYHDCFDTSVGKIGSENAVFVVLKPGVGYRWPGGTYVVGADPSTRAKP